VPGVRRHERRRLVASNLEDFGASGNLERRLGVVRLMALPPFTVSWDYRCPFARNAHEHLITALRGGADWDVTFAPFSLSQVHIAEGDPSVWEVPEKAPDRLAMNAGVVIRDKFADKFLDAHEALFTARHDQSRDIREEAVIRETLESVGVDVDGVFAELEQSWPDDEVRKTHEWEVGTHQMFGVPTFIVDDKAVFVRLMTRPKGDADLARATIEQVVQLISDRPEINEFKYTSIKR
jgi:2-hydroxychromene-2-carboxylate isomerase